MNKDHINAKISEALSASLGDWEKEFDNLLNIGTEKRWWEGNTPKVIKGFIRAEKEKRESEIKSALETIDWGEILR